MPPPAEGFAARFVLGPALRTQPDRRLVSLVRDGYETAFEEIVRRYGKPLSRYAAAIVGARGEDSGPGSSNSGRGPSGHDDNGTGANCTTSDLIVGATVQEAELELEHGGASFDEVALAG